MSHHLPILQGRTGKAKKILATVPNVQIDAQQKHESSRELIRGNAPGHDRNDDAVKFFGAEGGADLRHLGGLGVGRNELEEIARELDLLKCF